MIFVQLDDSGPIPCVREHPCWVNRHISDWIATVSRTKRKKKEVLKRSRLYKKSLSVHKVHAKALDSKNLITEQGHCHGFLKVLSRWTESNAWVWGEDAASAEIITKLIVYFSVKLSWFQRLQDTIASVEYVGAWLWEYNKYVPYLTYLTYSMYVAQHCYYITNIHTYFFSMGT